METTTATLYLDGKARDVRVGERLSRAIGGEMPCGGHGKCGKCRIIARGALSPMGEAERARLTEDDLARGVRLACMTDVLGDCTVETASPTRAAILLDGTAAEIDLSPTFSRYGAAVDIGTTTLAAKLYAVDGRCLAEAARLNPQARFGADVISRIEAALGGEADALARTIRGALDEMFGELAAAAGIDAAEIDRVVITGNTVMLCLLTETSVEPLSHAPFALPRRFGESLSAEKLDFSLLSPHTEVYLPPCMGAFVGADTTCAVLADGLCRRQETGLAVDIGTNGEMALWTGEKLLVCSTAAGPAFEGVGISMGMRGETGAISAVTLVNGQMNAEIIGGGAPQGICGSGLVDAAACLLALEVLDESGYLEDDPTVICGAVCLNQADIRALQLAKSAIFAGIKSLLAAGTKGNTPKHVSIAGGFGRYLNLRNAAQIGLLPQEAVQRAQVIGNAALAGAVMLLLDGSCTAECAALADRAEVLELATNPVFVEAYMAGMMF